MAPCSSSSGCRQLLSQAVPTAPVGALRQRRRHCCRRPPGCKASGSGSFSDSGRVPDSSTEFLREVSSASRCNLAEGGFIVTSRSPWQHEEDLCGDIKVVFVLGSEQGLFTLKTRRTRADVGRELSEVFSSERRRTFRKRGAYATTRSESSSSSSSGPMAPEVSIFAPPLQTYSRPPPARRRAPKPVAALGSVVEIDTISNGVPIFEELETAVSFQEQLIRQGKDVAIAEITSGQIFQMIRASSSLGIVFTRDKPPPPPL